jgi:hypothetical protein
LHIPLLVGYKTKWVSFSISILSIVSLSFAYSFGKINHTTFYELCPAIFSLAGWGACFSIDSKTAPVEEVKPQNGHWIFAFILAIAFAYFTAGFAKRSWSDLDLSTHGAMVWFISRIHIHDMPGLLTAAVLSIRSPIFWEGIDYITIFFEVGIILSLLHLRIFRIVIACIVLFHIANYFMLLISFETMVLIWLPFLISNNPIEEKLKAYVYPILDSSIFRFFLFLVCVVGIGSFLRFFTLSMNSSNSKIGIFKNLIDIENYFPLSTYLIFTIAFLIIVYNVWYWLVLRKKFN